MRFVRDFARDSTNSGRLREHAGMEGHAHSLTGLAVVVLAALGCGLLMRALRQPAVMGYILAGAVLGPSGIGAVENREMVQLLAELGVLMLLFLIGMELSISSVREVWKVALVTTSLQIAAGLGASAVVGWLFDWPTALVVVLGFVLALSSTAVAIKMLDEIGETRTRVGQITIGILIAQDLAVVPMMLIIASFGATAGGTGVDVLLKVLLSVSFLGLLLVYLGRRARLRLPFAAAVGKSKDLVPLAGLAFCFGLAALSGLLGLSAAYGAFLAGLILGNSSSRRIMLHTMEPIQAVLLMVFFMSIGLLIDLDYILDNLGTVIGIVLFVAIGKTALNVVLIRAMGENWPRAFLSGALLAQLGEFSFVLAAVAVSAGTISGEAQRLLVAVTVLSLLTAPFWLETARRLHRVILLGVTSGRETLRLTYGRDLRNLFGHRVSRQDSMIDMASGGTRWMGDIMPRRRPSDFDNR